MQALYRSLLRLYPADYFREYAGEMTLVFSQALEDARQKSLRARLSFGFREISGALIGALFQRLFGPDWSLPRRFDMRPEFRFPRSTVFLMCVILAGVVWAIEKAKVIQLKYGPPETMAVWDPLPWSLLLMLGLMIALAIGVWAVLFALHRSGMHRLANVQTWPDQR